MAAATKVANSPPGGAAARLKLEAAKITEEKLDAIRKEQKVRRHIREFRMRHVMGYVGGAVRGI